jgi:uncharacterized protein (TIGR03435 family)
MKTAFLFPGQGSQFVGMGKSLADNFKVASECFEQADDALGFSLSSMCFEGPEEASVAAPDGQAVPAESEPCGVPTLLTAIQQQLGLKLEMGKGAVEIIVIDHVERPSGN